MRLNPLRTVLSTAGVVIGVAALVAVLAIGDGVERFARDQIERSTDLQAIVVEPLTTRLLASVAERTREIGIRRSTGARARDILLQFLAESFMVTGTGSLLGIALGWAGAFAVTAVMRAQTQALVYADASLSSVLVAAFAAALVGIVLSEITNP